MSSVTLARSDFLKPRPTMSSTHCSTWPSRPRRLRSSSSKRLQLGVDVEAPAPAIGELLLRCSRCDGRVWLLMVISVSSLLSGARCSAVGLRRTMFAVLASSFRACTIALRGGLGLPRASGVRHVGPELAREAPRSARRARIVCTRVARAASAFSSRSSRRLLVDGVRELALLLARVLEALLVELQRVGVRLDADLDRAARLVRVDVVERGVRRLRRLDDRVDEAVGRRVVTALEATRDRARRRSGGAPRRPRPRPSARC